MAQGGGASGPAAAESVPTELLPGLGLGVAAAARGGEVHISTGTFDSQLGVAPAVRRDGFRGIHLGAVYLSFGEFTQQPRRDAGRGDDLVVNILRGGPGADVYCSFGEFTRYWQPRRGAARDEELVLSLVEGRGYLGALAGDLAAVYDNPATLAARPRRLLPVAGILASSAAVTGLAGAGAASPAAGFGFFALLVGGLLMVILRVLRA